MASDNNPVYEGDESIVVAIDIGTTHSAAAFTYLNPGKRPRVQSVMHWPGQPFVVGDSKIPTAIAYQRGEPMFYGAQAIEYLDHDEYEIAKWFKLHLHPESMTFTDLPPPYGSVDGQPSNFEIPELPEDVTLKQVYADFLKYIWGGVRAFFEEKLQLENGRKIWERLEDDIVVIICTPNGWDISQYTFLRTAGIEAGLVNETNADKRLEFITEAEASLHFALEYTQSPNWLEDGTMLAIVDAGGSTVDSTLYECKSTNPLALEEICTSECIQAGGVFVDRAAHSLFTNRLATSKYGDEERITRMVTEFEAKTKRIFDGSKDAKISCGFRKDNDTSLGIQYGKFRVSSAEMEEMFQHVILRIVDSCLRLLRGRKIQYLLLVGGFGESPYLRAQLHAEFGEQGIEVFTVREPSKKAAADGAILWFTKQLVRARAVRLTYGLQTSAIYKGSVHLERADLVRIEEDGSKRIQVFSPIVERGMVLPNSWEKVMGYAWNYKAVPKRLGQVSLDILVWEGEEMTKWTRSPDGNFLPGMRRLCTIQADMSGIAASITKNTSPNREVYWQLKFELVISFKRAKLQAQLRWKENGRVREGPVSIISLSTF